MGEEKVMEVPGFSSQCSGGQCGVWPWAEQVSVFTKNMMERGEEDWRSPNRRQGEVGAADTAQSLELQIELPRHTVNNYHGLASLSCLRPYRSCRGSHTATVLQVRGWWQNWIFLQFPMPLYDDNDILLVAAVFLVSPTTLYSPSLHCLSAAVHWEV